MALLTRDVQAGMHEEAGSAGQGGRRSVLMMGRVPHGLIQGEPRRDNGPKWTHLIGAGGGETHGRAREVRTVSDW